MNAHSSAAVAEPRVAWDTSSQGEVPRIAVVGLGYVGLPLSLRFAQTGLEVIGFDTQAKRIASLTKGTDYTNEVSDDVLAATKTIRYSNEPAVLASANFVIIAVPTPVNDAQQPDLGPVESAARTLGAHIKKGTVVVLESTVYPGVTEEILAPLIAETSGLTLGRDFFVGYSPERANPGDAEHTVDQIIKVVSGMNEEVLNRVDSVYKLVCTAGTHRAPTIRTAEAAKVIENIQRDLNIALMNELSLIFTRLNISTHEVLAAAGTKWNFHHYTPGLVGGHCIPVDPYYLTHLAQRIGYHPEVVLAGRRINDSMPRHLADRCIRALVATGRPIQGARVLVLGLVFKEDVKDTRNSKVRNLIDELEAYGVSVFTHDPLLTIDEAQHHFGGTSIDPFLEGEQFDAIVLAVAHRSLKSRPYTEYLARIKRPGVMVDVRGLYRHESWPEDITYQTL